MHALRKPQTSATHPLMTSVMRCANQSDRPADGLTGLLGGCLDERLDERLAALPPGSFPEYLPSVSTSDLEQHFVQGGFGALGNPASFHNPFVREWRVRALVAVIEHRAFAAVQQAVMTGDRTHHHKPRRPCCSPSRDRRPGASSIQLERSRSILSR